MGGVFGEHLRHGVQVGVGLRVDVPALTRGEHEVLRGADEGDEVFDGAGEVRVMHLAVDGIGDAFERRKIDRQGHGRLLPIKVDSL